MVNLEDKGEKVSVLISRQALFDESGEVKGEVMWSSFVNKGRIISLPLPVGFEVPEGEGQDE